MSVFWWNRIPQREQGLARPIAPGSLSIPQRLPSLAQVYGMPRIIGESDQVGLTGAIPQRGNYTPNPGSSPATQPRTTSISRGVTPLVQSAISIGLPLAGRALGVPGAAISVISSIINRIIGPAQTIAPIVPGGASRESLQGGYSQAGVAATYSPQNPDPATFEWYAGIDYGTPSGTPPDYASAPGGEYDSSELEMPSPVDTPYPESGREQPLDPESETPY